MLFQRCLAVNTADYTQKDTWTAEAQLVPSDAVQPVIRAADMAAHVALGKAWRLRVSGVLGSTGTPTFTFVVRLYTSNASIAGTVLAQSAAITAASGVSNQSWFLEAAFACRTQSTSASFSLLWAHVESGGGFASPYKYGMWPGGAASATWTASYSTVVDQYVSLSAACSASSGSNLLLVKGVTLEELN